MPSHTTLCSNTPRSTSSSSSNELVCGNCYQTFSQLPSLNRHRDRYHAKSHLCMVCNPVEGQLVYGTKIREHLEKCHGISKTVLCGCCHYIFQSKRELAAHLASMKMTGFPGCEQTLAKSQNAPGSLTQTFVKNSDKYKKRMNHREDSEDQENQMPQQTMLPMLTPEMQMEECKEQYLEQVNEESMIEEPMNEEEKLMADWCLSFILEYVKKRNI